MKEGNTFRLSLNDLFLRVAGVVRSGSLIGLDGEHGTQQQGTEPDLGALGILLGFWTHHWRITRILLVSTPG